MMKALEALVKADTTKTSGNHAVEYLNDVETVCFVSGCKIGPWQNRYDVDLRVCNGYTRKFTYHGNTICLVDDNTRKMKRFRRIICSDTCVHTVEELKDLTYDEDRDGEIIPDKFSVDAHTFSAMWYGLDDYDVTDVKHKFRKEDFGL